MANRRVLFVDDEFTPPIQSSDPEGDLWGYMGYYSETLKENGWDVITVLGPDEALAELGKGVPFDLAILDLMMPPGSFGLESTHHGMRTGARLAREIHQRYPDLPIVILSNTVYSESSGKVHDCQELVRQQIVKRLFLKPDFSPEDLFARLEAILSERAEMIE